MDLAEHSSLQPFPRVVTPAGESYERWAPTYDSCPNPLLFREERYLAPLLTDLQGKSVLDLACGTGRWLEKLLARSCKSAVGIDLSPAMLRVAAGKSALRGLLAQSECEALPFSDAVFDLVVCSFALEHIPQLGAVLRELRRVTRFGADIFVSDLHPHAYERGWRVGFRDRGAAVQVEVHMRSADELATVFSSKGFECLRRISLRLGQPERPLFVRAGKLKFFADACRMPAVLVCHFRKVGASGQGITA